MGKGIESDKEGKYLSVKFSPNGKYIAASTDNGRVEIYDTEAPSNDISYPSDFSHKKLKYQIFNSKKMSPFTCLKWRNGKGFNTTNVIGTVNSMGQIEHWHVPSGKLLSSFIDSDPGLDPQLCSLDYTLGSEKFAVAGAEPIVTQKKYKIRLKSMIQKLKKEYSKWMGKEVWRRLDTATEFSA